MVLLFRRVGSGSGIGGLWALATFFFLGGEGGVGVCSFVFL